MLKKLLMMSLAAFALAACNDEADEGVQYATSNPEIVDGVYSGQTMHFYGTAKVTNTKDNSTYSDPEAWFEIHGDKGLVIYMHQTRFAPDMPGQEMRIYRYPIPEVRELRSPFQPKVSFRRPNFRTKREATTIRIFPSSCLPRSRARSTGPSSTWPSPAWAPTAWSTKDGCW